MAQPGAVHREGLSPICWQLLGMVQILHSISVSTLVTKLTENQFTQFILKHLPKRQRGPVSKTSVFKIFNYIMKFLYIGCQWKELPIDLNSDGKPEIHYTRIFRIFKHWIRNTVFTKIFENSVSVLKKCGLLDTTILHGDGTSTVAKKGGDNIGYNGHKHMKSDKIAAFCDRLYNVIAPFVTAPGNRHESKMFPESFERLKRITKNLGISLKNCIASLDSAYDNAPTRAIVKKQNEVESKCTMMIFFKNALIFAWEDKFKRLLMRFERISLHHFSLKLLAYTMINLRHFCG